MIERPCETRPEQKIDQVTVDLRKRILSGEFRPGARLPNHRELAKALGVSTSTIQKAMSSLTRDGFVVPQFKRGTFVRDDPPHLCHYALVFPSAPNTHGALWSRFWSVLVERAPVVFESARGPFRVSMYHGVDGHADSEDFISLCQQVRHHRLAGLIFATSPGNLLNTPLMEELGLPRVAIADNAYLDSVPHLVLDYLSFLDRAIDYLAQKGKRRVAVMTCFSHPDSLRPYVLSRAGLRGLEIRPYWIQHVDPRSSIWACSTAHLLFSRNHADTPDALIITDDHLVEETTEGIAAAGGANAVEVVAHANFPMTQRSVIPVTRLGFHADNILRMALRKLEAQRQGQPTSMKESIPAQFDYELES